MLVICWELSGSHPWLFHPHESRILTTWQLSSERVNPKSKLSMRRKAETARPQRLASLLM
jgi:hypothetical protein